MWELLARDEREAGIDRAADRFAYLVLSYGLLLLAAYRSFVDGVASFDLLALVILGGVASLAYRLRHHVADRRVATVILGTMGLAVVIAGVAAIVTRG